jgi:hypothetical protein
MANVSLYKALAHREQAFHKSRQEQGSDLRSQVAAEFRRFPGYFQDLDSQVQEALLHETARFRNIPRTVEMFYQTVDQIAALPLSFAEKKERLIVTWVARGELMAGAGAESEDLDEQPTAWLWANPTALNAVDVLFVDEAGQMSLADVLAASQAGGSVVLLGDPQQLDQPQQGSHPEGADVSALELEADAIDAVTPEVRTVVQGYNIDLSLARRVALAKLPKPDVARTNKKRNSVLQSTGREGGDAAYDSRDSGSPQRTRHRAEPRRGATA